MSKKPNFAFISLVIVPFIIFLILSFVYSSYSKTLSISYWDEVLWIGRSSFFETFVKGDFKNEIWKKKESYDQPKLAEFAYGAWLYPQYLKSKNESKASYSYVQYLVDNGFYEANKFQDKKYLKRNILEIEHTMDGRPEEWVKNYGLLASKLVKVIYQARFMNVLLLSGAVLFGYFLVFEYGGLLYAIVFSFAYGFNTVLMDTSLKAHSESLFVFLFNGALLFMTYYIKKERRLIYLIGFSLMTGLCAATKLNGFMLVPVFIVVNLVIMLINRGSDKRQLIHILLPLIIPISIFILLNPFIYSHPLKNTKFMLDWRRKISLKQANFYGVKVEYGIPILKRMFSNFYYSPKNENYNGNQIIQKIIHFKVYGYTLIFLYFLGIMSMLWQLLKKSVFSVITLGAFLIVQLFMAFYLILDWPRYYVHMVYFFVFFQVEGFIAVIRILRPTIEKLYNKVRQ